MEDGGSDALVCLISRELCLFLTIDASKAPKKQRQEFVALAVRRAAPFPDPEFDIVWSTDDVASIWYWSSNRIRALLGEHTRRRQKFVAEATYLGNPQEEAVELLQLPEGAEGRIWKSGRLRTSRWWPQAPTIEQWHEFLRGTSQHGSDYRELPATTPTSTASRPWSGRAHGADSLKLAGIEQYLPKVAILMLAIILLVAGWQSGSILRAQLDIRSAAAAANSLDAPLQRILEARSSTDAAAEQIRSLLSLRGQVATTSLMAEFTRLLPGSNWQVKRWNQPTPNTLEVTLIAPEANPEQLVTALEGSRLLSSVTSDITSGAELTIKATIDAASAQKVVDQ